MSDDTLWYGYLEAGTKSSLVVRDNRLNTGDPKTIYLFNHKRGEILEYRLNIVQEKLRELSEEERAEVSALRAAFNKIRGGFTPRGARAALIPEKERPAAKAAQASPADTEFAFEEDRGDDLLADSGVDEIEDDSD